MLREERHQRIRALVGTNGGTTTERIAADLGVSRETVRRDVLGVGEADHAETNPAAAELAITPLVCSLAGQSHPVLPIAGSRAAAIYGTERSIEPFFCRYGVNPAMRAAIEAAGLLVSGVGEDGEIRIMELIGHPFFIGTLFVPQARSTPAAPHPLLTAFAAAAHEHAKARR